ncbi:methyltransferase [Cryptosporangium aurantiacum]|uniref:Phospholipid methyltransferase n=1 Tax=Cryptosporangium aurantiacum TaxID=134849 RepID=A0A1M7NAU6_9ACTN|nr:methyltransferase [Cryptosporangium aurantiacum]SHN00713.1 Phospholipid methyltransferase [Cryptosporangium aurantiacum]
MTDLAIARYAVLAVPVIALGAAAYPLRHSKRTGGALLLAFLTALVGVAALDRLARQVGWWSFPPVSGAFDGLPVDLWLGWAVLWGPLPVAVGRLLSGHWPAWLRTPVLLAAVGWVDAVTMPALTPLTDLGSGWGWGEVLGLLLVATPAVVLGECTASRHHLRLRVVLQLTLFSALVFWLLPTVVMDLGGGFWSAVVRAPRWWQSVLAQAALLAAVPGLAAVREFVERGGGTPYPWDPPERLVTTGPYAYLANPMQVSATLLTGVLAIATASWAVAAAAVMTVVFSEAVAEKHEDDDLRRRYGPEWAAYRSRVRRWVPRRRPAVFSPATLYVDLGCAQCRELYRAFDRRVPVGLSLVDAREYPGALRRVRYERGDGVVADGTAAVALAAGHVDAGLAMLGWLARLPGLGWLVARVADTMGLGPSADPVGRGLPSAAGTSPATEGAPEYGCPPDAAPVNGEGWRRTPGSV